MSAYLYVEKAVVAGAYLGRTFEGFPVCQLLIY